MESFLLYLLRVSAGTAAFYLLYHVLFSKRKQFRFNRIYLTGSFVVSMLIPLITITVTRAVTPTLVLVPAQVTSPPEVFATDSGNGISLISLLMILYLSGVLLFMIHLVSGHLRVLQIARKSRPERFGGIQAFVTEEDVHPFTFFGKIIVPRESTRQPYFAMILNHEMIHAGGRHTLDILLSEFLFLVQWFNPFAWLLKNAVRNNLEYLTDHEVTLTTNLPAYQMALVALAGKREMAPFLNALNGNDLKSRIIMMTQKTENRNSVIRKLMVVPLTALLITGLSAREYKTLPPDESFESHSAEILTELTGEQPGDSWNDPAPQKGALQPESQLKGSGVAHAGVLSADTVKKATDHIVITGYATRDGQVPVRIDADEMVVTHLGKGVGQVIRTGSMEAEMVRDTVRIRTSGGKEGPQPLYILDGQPVPSVENISPENIESISVLKNASSTALYGEKGKNGVILITTKKRNIENYETQSSSWGNKVTHFTESAASKDALIIIDGKESATQLNEINPDQIASVKVLKGEAATEKYGAKGERGVVEIETKGGGSSSPGKVVTVERRSKGSAPAGEADITNVGQLRQALARSFRYPVKAQESGQQGDVAIYAYVNGWGEITQITETKPGKKPIVLDEVIIVAYGPQGVEKPARSSNGKKDLLNQEGALQVKHLPALKIPEYYNQWLMFQFKFVLQ